MTVTKTIENLEKAFAEFNKYYFNNELPSVVIQYYKDKTEKAYGWITVNKEWKQGENTTYEIHISANFANRGEVAVYGTLLHEMAHLYNLEHKIDDTSNNGYFHNAKFKATAEKHGLTVERTGYGWSKTTPTEETVNIIATFPKFDLFNTYKKREQDKEKKSNTSFKHVCPVCGAIARTTKSTIRLICADCNELMEIEE